MNIVEPRSKHCKFSSVASYSTLCLPKVISICQKDNLMESPLCPFEKPIDFTLLIFLLIHVLIVCSIHNFDHLS